MFRAKRSIPKAPVGKPIKSNGVWCRIGMDLIDMSGGAQENEPKWIFHAKDHMSKMTYAAALFHKSAKEVAKAVRGMFYVYGPCRLLQHDRGREFVNQELKTMLAADFPMVTTIASRPRHPETNGAIERANAVLGKFIPLQNF